MVNAKIVRAQRPSWAAVETRLSAIVKDADPDSDDLGRLQEIARRATLYVESKQRGLSSEQWDFDELVRALGAV